jgi:hypothetical protein
MLLSELYLKAQESQMGLIKGNFSPVLISIKIVCLDKPMMGTSDTFQKNNIPEFLMKF